MGRKSRLKRERRLAKEQSGTNDFLAEMFAYQEQQNARSNFDNSFQKRVEAIRDLFKRYSRLDIAIALNVSDLWLGNIRSPVKHILAWRVLVELGLSEHGTETITTYQDFTIFLERLYAAWPEFPMLEDFFPEDDWGQIKISLGQEYVPMFYGSCIERTPDFIEAFRVTYAHLPGAQAQMDFVVALQSLIIQSTSISDNIREGELSEVPPEGFWLSCRASLMKLGAELAERKRALDLDYMANERVLKRPLTNESFSNSVMEGEALPFLGIDINGVWLPMSVRSAPGVVIDHWGKKQLPGVSSDTHRSLASFIADRFKNTLEGPLVIHVDDKPVENLPLSCVISSREGVYLICACDHESYKKASKAAKEAYEKIKSGGLIQLALSSGLKATLQNEQGASPSIDDIRIILVVTQACTAMGFLDAPERPTRLLSLADFITIFDSVNDTAELDGYWKYVESHMHAIGGYSGPVDLYASYIDSHGVLVEGAITPHFVALDLHWGTSWRYKKLAEFWALAPNFFPDKSLGWWLTNGTQGVFTLLSRSRSSIAYSTTVGTCTVQTLIEVSADLSPEDGRLIDLFAQLLVDCAYRCKETISELSLFQQEHVLFVCQVDPSCSVNKDEMPESIDKFPKVVLSAGSHKVRKGVIRLLIDSRAVLAGLHQAEDASFEVRCLKEVLHLCHTQKDLLILEGLEERLHEKGTGPARYYLSVENRNVDVPDYVDPIIPSPMDYKNARKQLANEIKHLDLAVGRYELSEAKPKIDTAKNSLRIYIEKRLSEIDRHQLLIALIEQHDALLISERLRIQRVQQSLAHEVEYDRLDEIESARKEYGAIARHYRYLLEKTMGSSTTGSEPVSDDVIRELIGLVDWFMVLADSSDVLHNRIDIGGVDIDDSFIPVIFYSEDAESKQNQFALEYAKSRLGADSVPGDRVEGAQEQLLHSEEIEKAFITDAGFSLHDMCTALLVLSQAHRFGFGDELSLSYISTSDQVAEKLVSEIEGFSLETARKIVGFLCLSGKGILRLAGRDVDESDVPYWEHNKRVHRYAIRPLISDNSTLIWGAEACSRSMHKWMSAIRDGSLPADFDWPTVKPLIRNVKQGIEKQLEIQAADILKRHTDFVEGGIDFFRKFRSEGFEDVGDFDVFAYWPDSNLLITVECKYNQQPYTAKDGRRLRDKIFGKSETDKTGHISKILKRSRFIDAENIRLLDLLDWPHQSAQPLRHVALYVSRDIYYWMVNPPYPVDVKFVRVEALDHWIKSELPHIQVQDGVIPV